MNSNDPRSIYYNRNNIRPKINLWKIGIYILPFIVFLILFKNIFSLFFDTHIINIILICIALIYIVFISKQIIFLLIRLYQKIAPEHIRNKCRFEPSCSNYMIMVVEKFGVIKGIKKGFHRLKRCSNGDGGYDNP